MPNHLGQLILNKERLEQRGNEKHNLEKKKKNGEKRQVDRKQL